MVLTQCVLCPVPSSLSVLTQCDFYPVLSSTVLTQCDFCTVLSSTVLTQCVIPAQCVLPQC